MFQDRPNLCRCGAPNAGSQRTSVCATKAPSVQAPSLNSVRSLAVLLQTYDCAARVGESCGHAETKIHLATRRGVVYRFVLSACAGAVIPEQSACFPARRSALACSFEAAAHVTRLRLVHGTPHTALTDVYAMVMGGRARQGMRRRRPQRYEVMTNTCVAIWAQVFRQLG